ncbi:MAG TPA: hypothetical protein PKD55_23490 [Bellilinea sp.]|nr:hypothetical protein [Bellilinea sp.]
MPFAPSQHLITRSRQRGITNDVIDLVLRHGSETDRGLYLGNREADDIIAQFKRAIRLVDRARNTFLGITENTITTVYRPQRSRDRGRRQ